MAGAVWEKPEGWHYNTLQGFAIDAKISSKSRVVDFSGWGSVCGKLRRAKSFRMGQCLRRKSEEPGIDGQGQGVAEGIQFNVFRQWQGLG